MKKLAVISTHPIQYNAPWFRMLSKSDTVKLKVYYTWSQSEEGPKFDPGFGRIIQWDIPLLDGYDYQFVENVSANPGTKRFNGIDNPTLIRHLETWKPDAIMVMGWNFKSHLAVMKHFKGKIPIIFRGDSTLLDEKAGIKKVIRRIFLRYIYRFVDYVFYVGENNKKYFLAHGIKESQLIYVPHAIDNDRFSDTAAVEPARQRRKELGIKEDDFVILFAGKLEPKKDPHMILSMAEMLKHSSYKFVIAGNGILEDELKLKSGSDKRIIFLGFQNQLEMPTLYRTCDLFILPSTGPGETWGLALNEAMAAGRPIISTFKTGGAIDLIDESHNGIIIAPGDVNSAVKFVEALRADKAAWQRASATSTERINNFAYNIIVKAIEAHLQKL